MKGSDLLGGLSAPEMYDEDESKGCPGFWTRKASKRVEMKIVYGCSNWILLDKTLADSS